MGTLYLVRHGQASFGADDYDQLSPLGEKQAQRLGEYWRERAVVFDAVYHGTLRRHVQTLQGIGRGLGGLAAPPQERPGLNEYDSAALLHAVHPAALPKADTPELFRQHFRLLCDALALWMQARIAPRGMPDWRTFCANIAHVLEEVRQQHAGKNVLLVSSGGPITTAITQVLGTAPEVMIGLNMRLRNSAVTEFSISSKRLMLQTFNTLAHLDSAEHRDWVSLT